MAERVSAFAIVCCWMNPQQSQFASPCRLLCERNQKTTFVRLHQNGLHCGCASAQNLGISVGSSRAALAESTTFCVLRLRRSFLYCSRADSRTRSMGRRGPIHVKNAPAGVNCVDKVSVFFAGWGPRCPKGSIVDLFSISWSLRLSPRESVRALAILVAPRASIPPPRHRPPATANRRPRRNPIYPIDCRSAVRNHAPNRAAGAH